VTYCQEINCRVRHVRGGLHSAKSIMFSFDFAQIEILQDVGRWNQAGKLLDEAAIKLQLAGADAIVLCTNTMHFVSQNIENASQLPLIHLVDPTAKATLKAGYKSVGLLGTRFTMEKDFYKSRLTDRFGLHVIVPDEEGRAIVHDVIHKELCNGIMNENSRQNYYKVIADLKKAGADCLILGCTEIGLLVEGPELSCQCSMGNGD
jgi:aspartate racemase